MNSYVFVVLVVCAGVGCAQYDFSKYSKYFSFPAGNLDETLCRDRQYGREYREGESWSTPYQGCKMNTCTRYGDNHLYIEQYSCPSVKRDVDLKALKANNYFCREASGDRRKAFPDCCARLVCKHYVDGQLKALPKHMYPLKQ